MTGKPYCLAFWLKVSGLIPMEKHFMQLPNRLPFAVLRRESFEYENIEALFFGRAGLLNPDNEDVYFKDLKARYEYICHKYRLESSYINPLQFFKHRPDNFPTIRLSQLAQLYNKHQNLFSKIIEAVTIQDIYNYF